MHCRISGVMVLDMHGKRIPVLGWSLLDLFYDKTILVQVMVRCCQTKSHYLHQCWLRSVSLYYITMLQWIRALLFWFVSWRLPCGWFCRYTINVCIMKRVQGHISGETVWVRKNHFYWNTRMCRNWLFLFPEDLVYVQFVISKLIWVMGILNS